MDNSVKRISDLIEILSLELICGYRPDTSDTAVYELKNGGKNLSVRNEEGEDYATTEFEATGLEIRMFYLGYNGESCCIGYVSSTITDMSIILELARKRALAEIERLALGCEQNLCYHED